MTTHVSAAILGPVELILLFVLLASPIILTIAHFFFMARFNNNRLNIGMTKESFLSDISRITSAESKQGPVPSPDEKPQHIHPVATLD
ncbi:MAG TPA: hypothetical protein HPP87_05735 [Planctomycetes bacterium]|nr:hypothetical protein [Planctomycetota bacterium]